MVTKASKNPRTSRARTKQNRSASSPKRPKAGKQKTRATSEQADRFVKDLLVRGEAVEPDEQGKLPPAATHGLTREGKDGTVIVKRARFKYF